MANKNNQIIESLSGDDVRLLEFIPYILQDLYSLGTNRELLVTLVERNLNILLNVNSVLDLCCGKGASIITLSERFGWSGVGIDLFEPFIEDARKNSIDKFTSNKVTFEVMDIYDAINQYRNYDIVLYGADVPSLGAEEEALLKISKCLSINGYLLYETAYLSNVDPDNRIKSSGFDIIDKIKSSASFVKSNNDFNTKKIKQRIDELIIKNPEEELILNKYLQNQVTESKDLEENYTLATYLLKIKASH